MPLDPKAEAIVQMMADAGIGFSAESTPESMRAAINRLLADGEMPVHEVHAVEARDLPGPAGAIRVRVYRPSAAPALPILVWFHGGGWVIGSLETHDNLCRLLCDDAGAIVVSVDYRLAPETKFPGAVDDWRMSPLRAPDLVGLPDAVVVIAEFDPLRDQDEAYGQRLRDAGVATKIVRGDGLFHGFFGMHAFLPPARDAWNAAVGALHAAFGTA